MDMLQRQVKSVTQIPNTSKQSIIEDITEKTRVKSTITAMNRLKELWNKTLTSIRFVVIIPDNYSHYSLWHCCKKGGKWVENLYTTKRVDYK